MNIIIVKRPLGRVQQRLVPASLSPYPRVSRRSRPPVPPPRRTWGMTRPERFMSSLEPLERKFRTGLRTRLDRKPDLFEQRLDWRHRRRNRW